MRKNPNLISFKRACQLIQSGDVVAIPTETVYGLAGDITQDSAIKKIFYIKQRPLFHPLIVHFFKREQLKDLCDYSSPIVEKLSSYFHPGPFTLVLKKKKIVSDLITANSNKVAVRIPTHPLTLKLMRQTQSCLAAPSANLFTKTSPTRALHVLENMDVPVLDGGPCTVGIESTIIEVNEEKQIFSILRPGIIGKQSLQSFLKKYNFSDWTIQIEKNTNMPGSQDSHYQPDNPFVIVQISKEEDQQSIEERVQSLYPNQVLKEFKLKKDPFLSARELYHKLRKLSQTPNTISYIIKDCRKHQRLDQWKPIWDRLEKAASKNISI